VPPRKRRRRRKPSAAKRAADALKYNAGHRRLRADLIATLIPGTRCPQDFPDGTVCGRPMYASQALHLGHTRDGSGYLGLVHALCNDRAAQLWRQYRRGLRKAARTAPARGRRAW
jgi:hypothetical protein